MTSGSQTPHISSAPEESRRSLVPRRSLVQGAAWTIPAITIAGAVPAVAASIYACTNQYGSGVGSNVWNTATDTPPRGTSTIRPTRTSGSSTAALPTVSFNAVANGGATLDPTYNMAFQNTGTNAVSSSGLIGNSSDLGLVLNIAGGGSETVTVTFDRIVGNITLYFRDLSWYQGVAASAEYPKQLPATPQEFVSFSVPTTVTNAIQSGEQAPALNVTGNVAANTQIYRTAQGKPPSQTNHGYYDLAVSITGPLTSFQFTFGYGPNATSTDAIIAQLTSMTFCAST